MAKKKKKNKRKQKQRINRARQKTNRPAARLAEAHTAAVQGRLVYALELAQSALRGANDTPTIQRSGALAAELHFRLACRASTLQGRLLHLEEGEALTPDDPRFALHRGIVLLVLQQPEPAQQAFQRVHELDPANTEATALIAFAQAEGDPTSMPEAMPDSMATTLALLTSVGRGDLSAKTISTAIDEDSLASLPGDDPSMWRSLLTMAVDKKSSRTAGLSAGLTDGLTDEAVAEARSLAAPLLDYYAGVAASRRNDHATTVASWNSAQADGLSTPWFQDNRIYLLRQSAEEAAAQEKWADVVNLLKDEPLAGENSAMQELLGYGYFHLGTVQAEAGNWFLAAEYWTRANALTPSRYLAQNLALAEELNENWPAAGEAWREMVRRRPRKADHPDYLNESQVATIWRRAAACYENMYDADEAISCLAKAVEYAPNNLAWRTELVKIYLAVERDEAAENELDRILEIDPDYLPALIELAEYYQERWYNKSAPIWRRALAVDETNEEVRDGLASALLEDATHGSSSPFGRLLGRNTDSAVKKLEIALIELPDHPRLLFELGQLLTATDREAEGRDRLVEAGRIAANKPGDNLKLLGDIMHELLHADASEQVVELMALVRQVPNLRADYWIDQGEQALQCDLDRTSIDRFWQEAIDLSQARPGESSPAYTLLRVIGSIDDVEDIDEAWMQQYIDLIDAIAPNCGLHEYADALKARRHDLKLTQRLFARSKRRAQAAGETEIVGNIETIEMVFNGPPPEIMSLLDGFDEDELAILRDIFE